jgi:hypothetical protein
MARKRKNPDVQLERDPYLESDDQAQLDELGSDSGQVGPDSAGQSGDTQGLSGFADADEESVEELAETEQPIESAAVEGVEDAEDHPERPTHTHEEYGHPEDVPHTRRTEKRRKTA